MQANSLSSTSIDLTWDQPELERRNGRITGYRIQYYIQASGGNSTIGNLTRTELSAKFPQLNKYTFYCFKVAARSHYVPPSGQTAYGPYSNPVCEQTQEDGKLNVSIYIKERCLSVCLYVCVSVCWRVSQRRRVRSRPNLARARRIHSRRK